MKKPKGTKVVVQMACGCIAENWFPVKLPVKQVKELREILSNQRCDKHKEVK